MCIYCILPLYSRIQCIYFGFEGVPIVGNFILGRYRDLSGFRVV